MKQLAELGEGKVVAAVMQCHDCAIKNENLHKFCNNERNFKNKYLVSHILCNFTCLFQPQKNYQSILTAQKNLLLDSLGK